MHELSGHAGLELPALPTGESCTAGCSSGAARANCVSQARLPFAGRNLVLYRQAAQPAARPTEDSVQQPAEQPLEQRAVESTVQTALPLPAQQAEQLVELPAEQPVEFPSEQRASW